MQSCPGRENVTPAGADTERPGVSAGAATS